MVNGIASIISPSDILLLVYRNATDFYILILYPATFSNELMSSNSFLVASLEFFMFSIVLSVNSDGFTSSFVFYVPFINFSSLIAVVRTSKTVLKKELREGILVLFLISDGKVFSFSPLRMMLAVGLSYMTFIVLRYIPSVPTFWRVFIINGCYIFDQELFPHLLR
uniref:Uncharacterized protein n=1 Tax=Sus scrofa TaxID=9823 RepID=A0A8D1NMK6_PIG